MSRANPASAALGTGALETVEPKAVNRPIAKATAAIATQTSAITSQRGTAEPRPTPDGLPSVMASALPRAVQAAGAGGIRLGGVLAAPVLLEERRDARVIHRVELELAVPCAEHHRRVETGVGREDHVGRRELGCQGAELVTRDDGRVVGDPHGAVLEGVHGVLVRLRLAVDAAVEPE